jgi:hypothetical protein
MLNQLNLNVMPKLTKEEIHYYRFHQICLSEYAYLYASVLYS